MKNLSPRERHIAIKYASYWAPMDVVSRSLNKSTIKDLIADAPSRWIPIKQRPKDQQRIFYYFEPFKTYQVGRFDKESDSVYSKSGFTTVIPEVPFWMPAEDVPNG